MATTYTVTAERGTSGVWVLECAELGAVSQTKRLANAADEMREALAFQAGLDPDELSIVVDVVLPPGLAEMKARAEKEREEAARLAAAAQASTHDLAVAMRNAGMTVRDMGTVLGVSYQRAQKLAAS